MVAPRHERSACARRWAEWTSPRSPASAAGVGISGRPASQRTSSTPNWSSSSVTRSVPSSSVEAASEAPAPGVLLVDKPAGDTSHDVVQRVRREHGQRAGHAGTLDPFATGLLLVLLGRATRLQRYLLPLPKTYRATAKLGWRSTTGDPDGELSRTGTLPEQLELPTGRVRQRVPMTSAVKVEGERLYRRAHRGESVETPE